MINLLRKYFAKRLLAIGWSVVIFVLLALPGSALPKEQGFSIPNFDKLVHIGLFGGFVLLWSLYYSTTGRSQKKLLRIFFIIFLIAVVYGIGMEFVQKYFIPGRDYDEADMVADMIGAGIAYGLCNIHLTDAKD